eukprot:IDg18804t1
MQLRMRVVCVSTRVVALRTWPRSSSSPMVSVSLTASTSPSNSAYKNTRALIKASSSSNSSFSATDSAFATANSSATSWAPSQVEGRQLCCCRCGERCDLN